jgi:hypothetical protein
MYRVEISRKLPHFRMIFAFRENEKKTVFVSTLDMYSQSYTSFHLGRLKTTAWCRMG